MEPKGLTPEEELGLLVDRVTAFSPEALRALADFYRIPCTATPEGWIPDEQRNDLKTQIKAAMQPENLDALLRIEAVQKAHLDGDGFYGPRISLTRGPDGRLRPQVGLWERIRGDVERYLAGPHGRKHRALLEAMMEHGERRYGCLWREKALLVRDAQRTLGFQRGTRPGPSHIKDLVHARIFFDGSSRSRKVAALPLELAPLARLIVENHVGHPGDASPAAPTPQKRTRPEALKTKETPHRWSLIPFLRRWKRAESLDITGLRPEARRLAEFLRSRGRRTSTISNYARIAEAYLKESEGRMDRAAVEAFLAGLKKKGASDGHLRHCISVLRGLFEAHNAPWPFQRGETPPLGGPPPPEAPPSSPPVPPRTSTQGPDGTPRCSRCHLPDSPWTRVGPDGLCDFCRGHQAR